MKMTLRIAFALALSSFAFAGCPAADDDDDATTPEPGICDEVESVSGADVTLEEIGIGLERPIDIQTARDGSGRIFVAEQTGRIRVFRPGDDSANTWFDMTSLVWNVGGLGDERGLLGLAFHPDWSNNGKLYVHYDDTGADTVVSEFTVADPASGEPTLDSERVILEVDQPAGNHNGGAIHFGPDGMLYIGLGDGGGAGDQFGTGQNPDTLLAKILRIDVDNPSDGRGYGIPADNPFIGEAVMDEAYVWGVRNPWKWSFDRRSGAMWIADVGQNRREEIDVASSGDNLGWPCREGFDSFDGCTGDFTDPVFEYGRGDGISITGGYAYRGCVFSDLQGQYFFSDFGYAADSPLWSITATGDVGDVWEGDVGILIATFGEDEQGELLTADYLSGALYRMVPN